MNEKLKQYNIFSAISMIIGIVIGSGIFFKIDDVLKFTGGSVLLGVLVFVISAISIVFGSLSIAQLAFLTDKSGGVITYMEQTWSKAFSGSFGFFHTLIYYPTLIVVISWVSGIYFPMLIGTKSTLEMQCILGVVAITILFITNVYAKRIGDYIQISSTIIKIIPLILIAFSGIFFGKLQNITIEPIINNTPKFAFISAIVPIAFSFDGWIVSTSISHEVKNAKKTLPIALVISPLFILIVYSLYLIGISAILGADLIMELGDEYVYVASTILWGEVGAKLILTFVLISVLGAVNGMIIGLIRMPYALAERGIFPFEKEISKIDKELNTPVNSAKIAYLICIIWYCIHYFVRKYDILAGSDVSEIAIVVSYVFYIALYIAVIKLYKKGVIKGAIKGVVCPLLALIGSVVIFLGSIIDATSKNSYINIKTVIFMIISLVIIKISYNYCKIKGKKEWY